MRDKAERIACPAYGDTHYSSPVSLPRIHELGL